MTSPTVASATSRRPPSTKSLKGSLSDAATLIVFEPGGVTGHPDHQAATASAFRVAGHHGLATLEWGVAPDVAARLNAEFATTFVPLDGDGTVDIAVDRAVPGRDHLP